MYPFLGEIQLHPRAHVPPGYLPCDGRELNVADHPLLFERIGGRFGGNGTTTFALPDLRGRSIVHHTASLPFGTAGGTADIVVGSTPTLSGVAVATPGPGEDGVPVVGATNYQPGLGLSYMIAVQGLFPRER